MLLLLLFLFLDALDIFQYDLNLCKLLDNT